MGDAGAPIVWDYHVILLAKENEKYKIFDFDSQLDFGCDVDYYFSNSFPQVEIPDELAPRFMIQSTKFFREHFQSNREHMKDEKGDFVEPEPSWKKISEESNLDKYLEMNTDKNYIVDLNEIRTTSWSLITERCYS